jgi:2-oxoglutarate ferredoxin oxidoreductase subunit alpha
MTDVATKEQVLTKGTDAVGQAAILAGCGHYYGYPITPQNEIPEYMSRELPKVGGVFLQSESETSSINMVFGAAAAGKRVMTSTSGPGYSLMAEGLSNVAGTELPVVLALTSRGGPGGGNLESTQLDYLCTTRSNGHGGYRNIVLAPASVQEIFDLTQLAFDLADKYGIIVIIMVDGTLVQMMEPVEPRRVTLGEQLPPKPWAITGKRGRKERNLIASCWPVPGSSQTFWDKLTAKYEAIKASEVRCETLHLDDAEVVVVAFGLVSRLALGGVEMAREHGIKAGMIRPITLWPFPFQIINQAALPGRKFVVVEGNMGQMLEDVDHAVRAQCPIEFVGQSTSFISPVRVFEKIKALATQA